MLRAHFQSFSIAKSIVIKLFDKNTFNMLFLGYFILEKTLKMNIKKNQKWKKRILNFFDTFFSEFDKN